MSTGLTDWEPVDTGESNLPVVYGEVMPDIIEVPTSPVTWKQGAQLLLDNSGSMREFVAETDDERQGMPPRTKAAAVDFAVRDLVTWLQNSSNAPNFSLGFGFFNSSVVETRPMKPVSEIGSTDAYNPEPGGGTAMWTALEQAGQSLTAWKTQAGSTLPVSTLAILLGDGLDSDPSHTLAAAEALKAQGVTVAATLLSTKENGSRGAALLQSIVSEPGLYRTVFTGAELRRFFRDTVTNTSARAAGDR